MIRRQIFAADLGATSRLPRSVLSQVLFIFLSEILSNGLWPVRTGRSLAGFTGQVVGQSIVIENPVEYAIYVEQRYGALEASIRLALPRAEALVDQFEAERRAAELAGALSVFLREVRQEEPVGA